MKFKYLVAGFLSAAIVALAACGGDDNSSSNGNGNGNEETVNVAYLSPHLTPYISATRDGVEAQVKEMGGGEFELFEGGNDPTKQLQQCRDAIATQRFQAFVIYPIVGATMVPCATEAVDAGIATVALGTGIGPESDVLEMQVDGMAGLVLEKHSTYGEGMAELAIQACKGKDPCNVVYQYGPPEFELVANSRKAFLEGIAENPNIEVVAEGVHNFDVDTAAQLTRQQLQANPDANVIVSDDDPAAMASLEVVQELGKDVQVTGGAAAAEGVEKIKSGDLFGSTVLLPQTAARKATEIAIQVARGEEPEQVLFDSVGELSPVGEIVTKENANEFEAEWSVTG